MAGCNPISIKLEKDATQLAFHMHNNSFPHYSPHSHLWMGLQWDTDFNL